MAKMIPIAPAPQTPEQQRPHIDMPDTTLPPGSTFVPKRGAPQVPVTAAGTGKAGATGVRGGAESVFGGDLPVLAGQGAGWLSRTLGPYIPDIIEGPGTPEEKAAAAEQAVSAAAGGSGRILIKALEAAGIISPETSAQILSVAQPTQADVASGVTDPIVEDIAAQKRIADRGLITSPEQAAEAGGPKPNAFQEWTQHEAENPWERGVQTAGGFVGAAAMPGSIAQRVARPILGAAGVELAGAAVPEEYEEAARIVAGLAIGAGMGANQRGFRERSAMRKVGSTPGAGLRVRQLLKDQGMTDQEAIARMKELGSEGTLMDVGPEGGGTTRQEAQRIQAAGGPGRGVLDPMLRAREAGSNRRLMEDVGATVGPYRERATELDALEQRLQEKGGEQRAAAQTKEVQPADPQGIVNDLDVGIQKAKNPKVRGALQRARDAMFLRDKNGDLTEQLDTSSEGMLDARQALSEELYTDEGVKKKGAIVSAVDEYYGKINQAIDPSNPALRKADAEIAAINKEREAFQEGEKVYEKGREAPGPVGFGHNWNMLSAEEQAAAVRGLGAETYRMLGQHGKDRVKLQQLLTGEGKWPAQKLETMIGPEKTRRLEQAIEREKIFQESYQKVVQGSKTAETQGKPGGGGGVVSEVLKAAPEVIGATIVSPAAGAGSLFSNAKRIATDLMSSRGSGAKEAAIAKLLTSQEPDKVAAGLKIMRERGSIMPQAAVTALLARQQDVSERKGQ